MEIKDILLLEEMVRYWETGKNMAPDTQKVILELVAKVKELDGQLKELKNGTDIPV